MKKYYKILILIFLLFIGISYLYSQITYFKHSDSYLIDTSFVQNKPRGYYFGLYHPKLYLRGSDSIYYGSIYNKNGDSYMFSFYTKDSSIYVFDDFKFKFIEKCFRFKNNFYFITDNDGKRFTYVHLVKVDPINRKLITYQFIDLEASIIDVYFKKGFENIKSDILTTDSSGNLKILCRFYDFEFKLLNLVFFFHRAAGDIWEPELKTLKRRWYIFDDDLNLLYTEDVK